MLCVCIAESRFETILEKLAGVEFAEIRLDAGKFSEDQIRAIFSKKSTRMIATHRPTDIDDSQRAQNLCTAIAAGAEYVDVEIESSDSFTEQVIQCARMHKCKAIVSYHNFECTPADDELENIITQCRRKGADVVKITCMAHSSSDTARMIALYRHENILSLAMGDQGKISRIAACYLGAPFCFVASSRQERTAPGQITLENMKIILDRISL